MIKKQLLLSASISTIAAIFASQSAIAQPATNSDMSKPMPPFHQNDNRVEHEKMAKHHMEKMWKKIDTDGDGRISRQEALAKASEEFDKKDLNHDGYLTQDEIKKSHHDMLKKHGEQMKNFHEKNSQ